MAMWISRPAAPNSAVASGMPTCTELPKVAEIARTLGTPLVMRMNLNQQSAGAAWAIHKRLLESTSPVVDCGVHYLDVMCQITDAPPVQVRGMGVRLSGEIAPDQVNFGHLQVLFADGSIGWYEAGWGPMISETAFFVKDVIGPKGSVSIVLATGVDALKSDDINAHTQTNQILVHHAELAADGTPARPDERLSTAAVERELIANDVSRARRAEVIDQHAAIFILQGALDRLANAKKS